MPAKRLAAGCLACPAAGCVRQRTAGATAAGGQAMVAAIRAAGQRDRSALQVTPLRDRRRAGAGRQAQQGAARPATTQCAASLIDQALAREPGAPDLLQERAEMAIFLHHYAHAEQLARASWRTVRAWAACARATGRR